MLTASDELQFRKDAIKLYIDTNPERFNIGSHRVTDGEFRSHCILKAYTQLLVRKGELDVAYEFPYNINMN